MDKVKVALTVLSIMIIIVPILVEVYVYKDNLEGLVFPPQIQNLMNGNNGNNNNGATAGTLVRAAFPVELPDASTRRATPV